MNRRSNLLHRVLALIVFTFALAGCAGGRTTTTPYGPAAAPEKRAFKIASTCGYKVLIVIHTSRTCQFSEAGYKGKFTIDEIGDRPYTISPTTGNRKTKFIIATDYGGSGYFTVTDIKNYQIKVTVRVEE